MFLLVIISFLPFVVSSINYQNFNINNLDDNNEAYLLLPEVVGMTKDWYTDIDQSIYSSPIIVDIDRDGSKDIITGYGLYSYEPGGVICIENNGSIKWNFNLDFPVLSSPAVADIDNDNSLDIVFSCKNNRTYCLNFNGTLKWDYDIGYWSISTPCIADLDDDGTFEIIVVGGTSLALEGVITCLANTGIEKWSYGTPGWTHSSPTVADLNEDGKLEVIVGCTNTSELYCLSYDGILQWKEFLVLSPEGWGISGSPIVVDIDKDLELEIIVSNCMGNVFCLNITGGQVWNYSSPYNT